MELRKPRSTEKNWGICYYCCYYLHISALWDPGLRCNDFVREFGFLLYCFMPTIASLYWCFLCMYTCSTSLLYAAFIDFSEVLSCVCYSACFHTISLYAFVFRTLPSLLLVLTGRRPKSRDSLAVGFHIIEVLTTCLLQFLKFNIHFVFLFRFKLISFFILTNTVCTKVAKTAKSELRFCLLFCCFLCCSW